MNETVFEMIRNSAGALKIDISVEELAMLSERYEFDQEKLSTIHEIFSYLADDSWDIRTAFLNYPDKVLVTPGQDS